MNTGAAALLLLVLAACLANLPFITERFFIFMPRPVKTVWWRLLELLAYYGIFITIGRGLEAYLGRSQPQAWQFYAITLLVFIVLAYPGFVFRYLRRSRGGLGKDGS